jgi:pyruvate formate lyase activating enzyme
MTVGEVMAVVLQDRMFYEDSGGGVTFSGGEPLSQPAFLRELLGAARTAGLHTAVDTCGLARTDHLLAIVPLTDLFLFDLKVMDGGRHEEYTGAPNDLILENLHTLSRTGSRIWVRVPVIPGMNDDAANLEAKARLVAGLPGVSQVNLLPFHRTGMPKARRVGREDLMGRTSAASPELVSRAAEIFRSFGLEVKTGG